MARLRFPDSNSIDRVQATADLPLLSASGATAVIYLDAAGTQLADDLLDAVGVPVTNGTFLLDSLSRLPEFDGPTSGQEILYARVDGGAPVLVNATIDSRLDAQDVANAGIYGLTITHGATAGTARPVSSLPATWHGTVAPTNAVTNDKWYDATAELMKRYDGAAWVAEGSSTYPTMPTPADAVDWDVLRVLDGTVNPPTFAWTTTHEVVARSLGWRIVTDAAYGAVGDGVADDTAELQAAFTAAGTIFLPPGLNFATSTTIAGESNTTVHGYGSKITLTGATNVDVLRWTEKSNVKVYGLEVDGQKSAKTGAVSTGRGIHFYGVVNGLIADCYVHDTYEHGIRVGGDSNQDTETQGVIVRNNTVKDCGNVANDRGYGIWCFWRVLDLVISGNIVTGCQGGGIAVDDVSSDATPGKECLRVVVADNIVRDSVSAAARGIFLAGTREFTVAGNVVSGNHLDGIMVEDGQAGADSGDGTVIGNRVFAIAYGVRLINVRDVLVVDNDIEMSGTASTLFGAVKLEKNATGPNLANVTVRGNRLRSNSAAINSRKTTMTAGITGLVVADNDIRSTDGAPTASDVGINLWTVTDPVVKGNTVVGFSTGIYADPNCTAPVLTDNVVTDCTTYGFNLVLAGMVVKGNVTRRNATAGFNFGAAANVASTFVFGNVAADTTPTSGSFASTTRGGNSF